MGELAVLEPRQVSDVEVVVDDLDALGAEEAMREAKASWGRHHTEAWRFALLSVRIWREQLFRPTYASFTEWVRVELGRDGGGVTKLRNAAEYVLTLPMDDRRAVMAVTPPATLSEAGIPQLARHDPEEAVRLALSGKTQRELKQAVMARLTDQHYDAGGLRTLPRDPLNENAYHQFMFCLNLTRFRCQTSHPTFSEVIDLMAQDYLSGAQLQPEMLERFPLRAILAGMISCIECGATNPQDLEAHHVVPRSHQGHDGPLVWLCHEHHQAVTESWEMHWRGHIARWRERKDLRWFRDAIDQWLGGRTLEEV